MISSTNVRFRWDTERFAYFCVGILLYFNNELELLHQLTRFEMGALAESMKAFHFNIVLLTCTVQYLKFWYVYCDKTVFFVVCHFVVNNFRTGENRLSNLLASPPGHFVWSQIDRTVCVKKLKLWSFLFQNFLIDKG